ncbi:exodeoxyribonuclease III, partial [Plasmodium cynomolgi strain B]
GGEKIQKKGYSGLATYVGHKAKIVCCCSDPFRNVFFSVDGFSEGDLLVSRCFPRDNSSVSFYALPRGSGGGSGRGSTGGGGNDGQTPRQSRPPDTSLRRASDLFNEGRVLITIHKQFVLVNVYAPYSGCNYNRLDYKMRFLHAVRSKLLELRITTGLPIILVGDLNISFRNRDVHYLNNIVNLDELQKQINKVSIREDLKKRICKQIPLIIETLSSRDNFVIKKQKGENGESFRLYLKIKGEVKRCCTKFVKNLLCEDKMVDLFSFFYPSLNGKFTCWDTYKQHRMSNEGSRIDYIFVDFVLYERLIRGHSHLYESPVVLTDELRGWLCRGGGPSEATRGEANNRVVTGDAPHNAADTHDVATPGSAATPRQRSYLWVNSPENNCNYANYFNRLRKKTGRIPTEDEAVSEHEEEIYHFQFKLRSYIGFIYTSPRLSDHIAVNCTFLTKAKSDGKKKRKQIPICFSAEATIPLRNFCFSTEQYASFLPLYLIDTPLFSGYAFKFLQPVHAHGGTCPSVAQAQPHKKTNKITQYFSIKRGKR